MKKALMLFVLIVLFFALYHPVYAESMPSATAIPYPLPDWKGVEGKTLKESKPYFLPKVKPPEGAPNVLVIMIDDGGFANAETFGGPIKTPAMDRLSREGLTYTQMSTTAVCSPTRASLLTGRNHHSVGTGIISEYSTGYTGYNSEVDYSTASIAAILTQNGYASAAFGKWHNTPVDEISPIGPFGQWPTQFWGFEYFYGFLGGETNQFHPLLVENTSMIETPKTNFDGSPYHLTEDLADQTIKWLDNWKALRNEPFFIYWTPGAVHAPLHVPADWRDKYKGQFDDGWDAYRQKAFERQKAMGVIPQSAELTPRPEAIPAWESFSEKERKYLSLQMEIYAAMFEHTDSQVQRILQKLEKMGQLDNTFILYLTGDNGASGEGTLSGTFSELLMLNGFPPLTFDQQFEAMERFGGMDAWGGPEMHNHYSVGWAWAGNAPFQWVKQMASHFGGTRAGMVVRYPELIKETKGIRTQFHHVTDIVPTILEITKVPNPDYVNGIKQKPMDGISFAYSLKDGDAPGRRKTQYFEMLGFRGIYSDGWMASATPYRVSWRTDPKALANFNPENDQWELYDLAGGDFTQAKNVAQQYPEKLEELKRIFDQEAKRNHVYPIGASLGRFLQPESNPQLGAAKQKWVMNANIYRVHENSGPNLKSRNWTSKAELEVNKNTEGVIFALGDVMGGLSLYIKDHRLKFNYSMLGLFIDEAVSDIDVPEGDVTVEVKHTMIEKKLGGPARVELLVDGKKVGETTLKATVPLAFSTHEPFDVGRDSGSAVATDYRDKGIFRFKGVIKKVTFELN